MDKTLTPDPTGGHTAELPFESMWRQEPFLTHAAAILVLVLAMTLRFAPSVLSPVPVEDERVYFEAFERVLAGGSPYQGSYYYSPALALAGAWSLERFGTAPTAAVLRAANLTGMAVLAWCALAWLPWSWRRRLAAAALFVVLSPAVRFGVQWGNLSLVAVGALVLGLVLWPRRPVAAGFLLAASLVIKPIGPVAVGALLVHRPANGGRRHLLASGLGLALAAALYLPLPWLDEMLSFAGKPDHGRNAALHHVLYCFGVHVDAYVLVLAVGAATLVAARFRRWAPAELLGLAGVTALLATSAVWSHTLLVVLPLQAMALYAAFERRRSGAVAGLRRRYELAFVVLAVTAIQLCEGLGGLEDRALVFQGLAASVPALAPAVLFAYLLRKGQQGGAGAGSTKGDRCGRAPSPVEHVTEAP